MFREHISVKAADSATGLKGLYDLIGSGEGSRALRAAPLLRGASPYWYAAARIRKSGDVISEVILVLQGPDGTPRRLAEVEDAVLRGELADADQVLDAVKEMIVCEDDKDGSAAAKSFLAGWICADVIGRCLSDSDIGAD